VNQPFWMKKRPALIFADSMSDWWSPGVEWAWLISVMGSMQDSPQHRFVVLTKRPDLITDMTVFVWPPNAWLGVSITSGADWWRWEALARLPQSIHKFISVEPLLGPGVATRLYGQPPWPEWVIVGPQSGPGAAPVEDIWQSNIRAVCIEHCLDFPPIPLFEKSGLPMQPPIRQMPPELKAVFRKGGVE
jgi:protein gp37